MELFSIRIQRTFQLVSTKQIYISDFVAVFGRFPEGWAQEELESANGTEVAPAPEEFISPETDGAVNMDDPAV